MVGFDALGHRHRDFDKGKGVIARMHDTDVARANHALALQHLYAKLQTMFVRERAAIRRSLQHAPLGVGHNIRFHAPFCSVGRCTIMV